MCPLLISLIVIFLLLNSTSIGANQFFAWRPKYFLFWEEYIFTFACFYIHSTLTVPSLPLSRRLESYSCKLVASEKKLFKSMNAADGLSPNDLEALSPPNASPFASSGSFISRYGFLGTAFHWMQLEISFFSWWRIYSFLHRLYTWLLSGLLTWSLQAHKSLSLRINYLSSALVISTVSCHCLGFISINSIASKLYFFKEESNSLWAQWKSPLVVANCRWLESFLETVWLAFTLSLPLPLFVGQPNWHLSIFTCVVLFGRS